MLVTRLSPDTLHKNPAYSQAAVVAPGAALVFVGGQNGVDTQGQVVGPDIASQTTQAMRNVEAALAAAGASWQDVFKMAIYLAQGHSLQAGYAAAMPFLQQIGQPPIVTALVVTGLGHPAAVVEIEAVAAIRPGAAA
jgi:enamine deaminase RidA (YjgF/YER057c/UK114 family)